MATPVFNLPALNPSSNERATVNTALSLLDVLSSAVDAYLLNTPPSTPINGYKAIIGAAPTGIWSAFASHIAVYLDGWYYYPPSSKYGIQPSKAAPQVFYQYDGTNWVILSLSGVLGGGVTTVNVNGTNLPQRPTLKFLSSGVTGVDNSGNNSTDITIQASSSASGLIAAQLNAFGDSITLGTGASTLANSYIKRIGTSTGWTVTNNAVSGTEIGDSADTIYSANPSDTSQYVLAFGANDIAQKKENANGQSTFADAIRALAAWLAIPASRRIKAQSSDITYGGTWANSANYGGTISRISSAGSSTATFSVTGSSIIIGYSRLAASTATFSVTVDSGAPVSVIGSNAAATTLGKTVIPATVIVENLSETWHSVTITVTSGTLHLDWVAGVSEATQGLAGPNVYLSNSIRLGPASFSPTPTFNIDVVTGIYNQLVRTAANKLKEIGLAVQLINVNARFNTSDWAPDMQHPNDAGHLAIANAFLDRIFKTPGLSASASTPSSGGGGGGGGPAPTITSFTPSSATPGAPVVITGTNFTGTAGITIGATPVSYVVNSATQITLTTPSSLFAGGTITVTTPSGAATSATQLGRTGVILQSAMGALPPIDTANGHPATVAETALSINNTNFDSAPSSLNFNNSVVSYTLLNGENLTGDFEIEIWARPTQVSADDSEILCIRQSAAQADIPIELMVEISTAGALRFRLANTVASVTNFDFSSASGLIVANTGYFIKVAVIGTTASIYINGTQVATTTVTGVRNAALNTVMLGAIYFGPPFSNRYFVGQLDSLKITKL
jgi:Concanavalin A-like lectin/glucanases superfamily/Protein of unknown function (DUF2793)